MSHYMDWMYLCSTLNRPLFKEGWGDIFSQKPDSFQLTALEFVRISGFSGPGPLLKGPGNARFREGSFASPYVHPNFPEECRKVPFRLYPALRKNRPDSAGSFAILIPASGDAGYAQRHGTAVRLQYSGCNVILAEGPYYGQRKPEGQCNTSLRTVGDLGHLGTATVLEARFISAWLYHKGVRDICIAGISRGGQLAIITAALTRYPLAVACSVGSFNAGPIFTEGLMSKRVSWGSLRHPLGSERAMNHALRFSDVCRYPPPANQRRIHLIGARSDGYVRPEWVERLHRHIPESTLEWVNGGHVSAFLFARQAYINGILATLNCQL